MPTDVTVRAATEADAAGLAVVTQRAYAATYPGIVPEPVLAEWIDHAPTGWKEVLALLAADNPARVWLAERGSAILGYATTAPAKDWWLPPPDGAGELTNLYLDPDAIGFGIGRMLYERAVDDLRQRNFNPFVVWAFRDNARAVHFYERMGLVIDVADHDWLLADVSCSIVRFRADWPEIVAR